MDKGELICQVAIPIFSGLGVYFVSRIDNKKRYGYIFGLCSQPFWFYTLWNHQQWGLFALSLFFTSQWLKGVWNYWFAPIVNPDWLKRHQWFCIFWQLRSGRESNHYDGVCYNCRKDRYTGKII